MPDLFARVVPILRSALPGSPRDPRVAGLRRRARIVVTGWVACVIPLLAAGFGYLLLYLPQVNRALWHSASHAARLGGGALAGHRYAAATADGLGLALALLSIAGMLYVVWGLVRRAFAFGRRWSAGRPRRRLLALLAAVACAVPLSVIWLVQGQFSDW